ncbi:hypothetical protein M3Y94_01132000 [Aphelenchoides besseyi]|nr:hypothetical protein M3Y94_01132000 [Aphelenchoides besseyi]KAI6218271.1 hypothetical protein M3Y95_01172300 [Aphelenchoides besseyi]
MNSPICNCSLDTRECQIQLSQMLTRLNNQIANEFRKQPENLIHADLYSCFILFFGASIILLLMVRVISPSKENLDDQVTNIFASLHAKCELENNVRHKAKLAEAKRRAQRWLNEAKLKSVSQVRKLSRRRSRSTSESAGVNSTRTDSLSIKSQLIQRVSTPQNLTCQRAASYQFLPEIIVTSTPKFDEPQTEDADSSISSRPMSSSRASSAESLDEVSNDSYALDPFMNV